MKFTSHGYKHLARWFIWIFSTIIFILAGDLHSQCLPHNISSPNAINDVIYACAGDGKPDNVIFAKLDTSHTKYAFVLADLYRYDKIYHWFGCYEHHGSWWMYKVVRKCNSGGQGGACCSRCFL